MVRDAADGVGVWRCDDITAIANVNTLTFESLLELCEGEYGAAPTRPGHVILAVNCSWGPSSDIGQFWQKCARPPSVHQSWVVIGIVGVPIPTIR